MQHLLDRNKLWAAEIKEKHPVFFDQLKLGQKPQYLWFGCSDSRLPEGVLTAALPGEFFVHRNVGNQVMLSDLSSSAVVQYAIDVLEIEQVMVCGHYHCGGVIAALEGGTTGAVHEWLSELRALVAEHKDELDQLENDCERQNRMSELNVLAQVQNLDKHPIIKAARARGKTVEIHGIIYDIEHGHLNDLSISRGA